MLEFRALMGESPMRIYLYYYNFFKLILTNLLVLFNIQNSNNFFNYFCLIYIINYYFFLIFVTYYIFLFLKIKAIMHSYFS